VKKAATVTLAILLLGACVSAPPTTPQVGETAREQLGLANDIAPEVPAQWWQAFGDPQLNRLIDEAFAGSPTLAAAMARVREAQSQLAATRAATDPQLSIDAQDTRERQSASYIIPPPYAGTWRWSGTAAANLSWSLDLFGKEQAEVDRARALVQGAAYDGEAARLLLAGTVAVTYVQLARSYALIDAADATVRERQTVLQLVRQRLKSGLDNPASVKQASAQLALARQDLLRTKAERDTTVHLLAALTGKGAQGYDIARPQLNPAALRLPAILPADLLARRADIAAAKARVNAATAGRQAAHQAFYPDINLIGTVGVAAIGLSPLFTSQALQYGGGAALHLPIFDAGRLRANYAGATATLDETVANYNAALVTAVRQTADAIVQLKSADAQMAEVQQALTDAKENHELAAERYRNGLVSELTLLSAEETLIQARRQAALVESEQGAARVTLVMALGGGFGSQSPDHVLTTQGEPHE
jgi:NodT family efflux transporter outer membrane factor (OMF) lipoprotein